MAANTTNRAYTYPQSTDDFRPYEDIQELATDIDTDVQAIVTALTTWTSYTPTLYSASATTRVSIGKTVNHAQYLRYGNVCYYEADVTATANSTGGTSLSLPITASQRWQNCGTAIVSGTAPPTTQAKVAYMSGSLDSIIIVTETNGFLDIISGQTFRMHGFYKV